MKYTIETTEEQEEALKNCDFTPQQAFNERIAPVVESMKTHKIQKTYEIVQANEDLKTAVETKMAEETLPESDPS